MGQKTHVTHTAPGHKQKQQSNPKKTPHTHVIHPPRTTKKPQKVARACPKPENTTPKKKKKKKKKNHNPNIHPTETQPTPHHAKMTAHPPKSYSKHTTNPQKKKTNTQPYIQWHKTQKNNPQTPHHNNPPHNPTIPMATLPPLLYPPYTQKKKNTTQC